MIRILTLIIERRRRRYGRQRLKLTRESPIERTEIHPNLTHSLPGAFTVAWLNDNS